MIMSIYSGRLFWKILLALFLCMALSMIGTFTYIALTNKTIPLPPPHIVTVAHIPIVPLLSGLLAILLIGFPLAWYLSRPIHRLRWALQQIAEGRFDTRVTPLMYGRRDELADLGLEFDRMAEQLQKALESQRVLLHDVSHELRSPLARMQAAIGLFKQNPQSTTEMLTRIETESARLDILIDELLTLHRMDSNIAVEKWDRVDLIELLHVIIEDADFEAKAKKCNVNLFSSESFVTEVQGELICRAFENVIRNAVKYTSESSTVEVCTYTDLEKNLIVTVTDRGCGIPPELLEQIFDPFFRVEGSGSVRGTGLGLAIARKSLAVHGGKVFAQNRTGGGLEVTMTIPPALSLATLVK
jgi:signal transduction histidine kinase